MAKIILSINAGSSSLKLSLYNTSASQSPKELAEIQIDGLTSPPPQIKYTRGGKSIYKNQKLEKEVADQKAAFEYMLDVLIKDEELGEVKDKKNIGIACHRVVCSSQKP